MKMIILTNNNIKPDRSNFNIYHTLVKTNIDSALNKTLDSYLHDTHPSLGLAIRHAVLAGGQRLRPLAMALSAASIGIPMPIEAMQAIELIHNYSLIHDDLPALDNDEMRRGQLSVHAKFGEATAILAGDALIAMAFDIIGSGDGEPVNLLALSRNLAISAGPKALVDGQTRDILPLSDSHLDKMPLRKTGSLFAFATVAPYIFSGYDKHNKKRIAVESFGSLFGLAYQYYDDLKDKDTSNNKLAVKVSTILNKAKSLLLPWKEECVGLINLCNLIKVES